MRANLSSTMAGWLEGAGICRQILLTNGFLEIALIFIAICACLPTTSYAQVPGFLSIDCGSTHNYTDSIGLEWVTDNGTYIKTGKSFEMSPRKSNLAWYDSTVAFSQSLTTFRYFPEGRNKYCYEVPTTPKSSYLIRSNFYLNVSVLKDTQPLGQSFLFTVSINATDWFTIAGGEDTSQDYYVVQEGIFYSPATVISFCLQPVIGVPFINSLELRKLEDSMYSYSGSQNQYLVQLLRYNPGIKSGIPALRWPDDKFDRIWFGLEPEADKLFQIITGPPDNTTYGADVYFVPGKVMQDAWLLTPNISVQATLFQDDPRLSIPPGQYAFAILYTQHLNFSDTRIYPLNASLDGYPALELTFSTQPSLLSYPNYILSSNFFTLEMTLGEPGLADGPTMNGCEIYAQYNFNFSATNQTDAETITVFKESFSLNDWQGDPCLPVPHDWLSCSVDSPTFQPIRQPCSKSNGTSVLQCVVQEGFLRSTYYVKSINLTDLPTSGFGLLTATPNVTLDLLSDVSITNSGVDSRTFQYFVQNISTAENLVSLDFSYNAIASLPDWSIVQNLTSVDLSNNYLADLLDIKLPNSLRNLNLSHNLISSVPPTWQNNSNTLLVLDLSNNKLSDGIISLDQLTQMNDGSLQVLDVSQNSLTGTISSSIYFSLPNLTVADFSHNSIQGTLNLSLWYAALKAAESTATKNVAVEHLSNAQDLPAAQVTQLFSFVNNDIVDIVPDASTFEATFTNMDTGQGGVLLGGNPYCNGAKSYTQRYLCRDSVSDTIEDHHKESKVALIVSIIGGTVAFVLCCIILATLWRMWKQIYALREIQRALAKRKVQPPFYQYSELRSGTKDFHKNNKLGHGSFGVVYKAELVDGTQLALKTLFDSQRVQSSLDDFLNEVVVITGIKHRNLVQLKGCCIKDKERMLVYEYAEKGNLAEALWGSKAYGGLNWEQRFNTCLGVARGLAYLHEELQPSIIHRDIKPANILLDKNSDPKIADFGLARHCSDEGSPMDQTDIAGTLGYLAPEYAQHGHLSEKADVYSYGIVVLEIVSGRKCIDLSLPVEERFLTNWACDLIKGGNLLAVLQPDLRDCCVSAEVIRAINIGLLCVQHRAERRPSMSQVVTMLAGSMDVEGFIGDAGHVQSSFKELLSTISQDIDYTVLRKLAQDSTMYPLLSLDSQASVSTTEYISKKRIIELGNMHGALTQST